MLEKIIENTSEYIDSMPKMERQGIWLNYLRFQRIKIK